MQVCCFVEIYMKYGITNRTAKSDDLSIHSHTVENMLGGVTQGCTCLFLGHCKIEPCLIIYEKIIGFCLVVYEIKTIGFFDLGIICSWFI